MDLVLDFNSDPALNGNSCIVKKVKTSIYIARFMHQAPLTRTSLKLTRQTAIKVTAQPANTARVVTQ